jgi:hypothetical protein
VQIFGRKLPRRVNPYDKTEGFLLIGADAYLDPQFAAEPDGRLRSRQIRAGQYPAAGVGLKPPYGQATAMDHVEAQAAAIMRRPSGQREATLVLNQRPCNDAVKPLMCEKILSKILPAGSRLTVYLTDGDRTWQHGVYVGTGEGAAR